MMADLKKEHQIVLDYSRQILSGAKIPDFSKPFGKGYTPRCVETPWVAFQLKGVKKLLDVGFTFASPEYLGMLLELKDKYGVDLKAVDIIKPERVKTRYPQEWLKSIMEVPITIGDVRKADLPKDTYEAVTIVSTIEHIGFDEPSKSVANSAFERKSDARDVVYSRDPMTEKQVLENLRGTLKPGGKLIITVPMGKGAPVLTRDSLGFYTAEMEYDSRTWESMIGHKGFSIGNQKFFKLSEDGWVEAASAKDLESENKGHGCAAAVLIKS